MAVAAIAGGGWAVLNKGGGEWKDFCVEVGSVLRSCGIL